MEYNFLSRVPNIGRLGMTYYYKFNTMENYILLIRKKSYFIFKYIIYEVISVEQSSSIFDNSNIQ